MRSTRRRKDVRQDEGVPAVYREMLFEEHASEAKDGDVGERPLKRRKTTQSQRRESLNAPSQPRQASVQPAPLSPEPEPPTIIRSHVPTESLVQQRTAKRASIGRESPSRGRLVQTIIDSDESDESDMEWEDALGDDDDSEEEEELLNAPQVGDITIEIGSKELQEKEVVKKQRKRAITSVEKKRRLDIHKMHVLCLLYHIHRRNTWCNDRRVQSTLRKIVSPKILSNLVPDPDITQYSASKRFIDSMNDLKLMWSKRFKITKQGMHKPRWIEVDAEVQPFSDFDDFDRLIDKDEFRTAAHSLQGSQDIGVQLFCALLRGIGIEARLVCSLQPLPFASAAERATPQKPGSNMNTIVVDPFNKPAPSSPSKPEARPSQRPRKLSRLERIMGERHAVLNQTGTIPKKQKAYHMQYPVYWVEAFNSAHQKWVPIDTHSTFTVNAPEKLEPPIIYSQNSLTYAVAFDEDYTAKDVTRRYARAYNAKTRKFRVECTPHGKTWWRKTLNFFRGSTTLDRDQIEDAALARKEAAEGIPHNIQDFKGHPVYVLERHLKHNEVIHPLTQAGRVNVGTSMNPKTEPIYRRSNVHIVRSSDKWYRMGRDVKIGEQPLKHAKPKKGRQISVGPDTDVDEPKEEDTGAALYAEFQTELYIPPPVIKGHVPRNVYGNLDLYVPSMCPTGGTHVRHKLAAKAARIVGVDYADAVTGFSFKGRHGTAIVQGVVVASENADAVQVVIDGMEYQQEEAQAAARASESLRLWRRFLIGLRIAQRVNAIEIDGEKGPAIDVQEEISRQDRDMAAKEMAGGFFPDEGDVAEPEPARRQYEPPVHDEYGGGGGFMIDDDTDDEGGGGLIPDIPVPASLNRQHSFESSILDSQQLLPRRRSSLGDVYSSDEDGVGDYVFDGEDEAEKTSPSIPNPTVSLIPDHSVSAIDTNAQPASSLHMTSEHDNAPAHWETTATQAPQQQNALPAADPVDEKVSSTPSDAGSLLLEDPEDEDADPDWLVDVT